MEPNRELGIAASGGEAVTDDPISVRALTKTFGKVRALDGVTLRVAGGETFGLIGPNGSGKTTLLRLLLGLGRPTSGQVCVLGRMMPDHRVAGHIGYMTQASALYSELSVRENLAFFGTLYGLRGRLLRTRLDETLALVDLAERAGSPVQTLSGGMRQRVSLACALIHQPRLLFLDEPTVGIDPELRHAFWDYFARLNQQGVTIVVSTHHLDEAARCHRIALLRFGKLLVADTPDAIRRESGQEDFERAFLYFAQRHEATDERQASVGGAR
ncbi:MAG TPA: ABC transporter ATP-binding protein [Ktedonobacterales bacterium]|nr:ABC transporter ATP-binding protein [Ktedonobacterales bacterium]